MVIEVGNGVILKKGKNLKYVCVSDHKTEKLENFLFSCVDMIGKPYGTAFKIVDKKKLEVIDPVLVEEHAEEYENEESEKVEETKDNRTIQDNPDSQKLTKDEIMSLREGGTTGEDIVKELVENSATFKNRTEYSKAKYLKKKKKKYLAQFVALKPTARLLSEMYFFKNPGKIMEVRPDSLAQILTWSNCQSNSKVLLMDTCQGFVAGALLERLGLNGNLVQLYQGSFPVRIIMEQFNFSLEEVQKKVCSFPLEKLAGLQKMFDMQERNEDLIDAILGRGKEEEKETKNGEEIKKVEEDENMPMEITNEDVKINEGAVDSSIEKTSSAKIVEKKEENKKDNWKNKRKRHPDDRDDGDGRRKYPPRVAFISREERITECLKAMEHLRSKDFDSLVIVAKYHPKNLLLALWEFIPRACPFVVYFTHQEPLMDCYVTLRERNMATNVELTESWLRNVQVLPKRTHPEIVMSATGGYILRGVKVEN